MNCVDILRAMMLMLQPATSSMKVLGLASSNAYLIDSLGLQTVLLAWVFNLINWFKNGAENGSFTGMMLSGKSWKWRPTRVR